MAIFLVRQIGEDGLFVKSCIVKNDNTFRLDFFQQTIFKPIFKQNTISRSAILQRRHPLPLTYTGNNIGSLKLFAADFFNDFLSARRVCKVSVQILINTTFINVYKVFNRYCFQLFHKLLSKTFVNLLVKSGFFYALFLNA